MSVDKEMVFQKPGNKALLPISSRINLNVVLLKLFKKIEKYT